MNVDRGNPPPSNKINQTKKTKTVQIFPSFTNNQKFVLMFIYTPLQKLLYLKYVKRTI